MQNSKSLNKLGLKTPNILFSLFSLGMIITSIYLTVHYIQTFYPATMQGSNVCDSTGFFNCNSTAFSPISNIFGVPIAVGGLVVGLIFFFSSIFAREEFEKTNKTLSFFNFAGCLALFVYSLSVLGSLCPYCTAYYVFSTANFLLLFKFSSYKGLDIKASGSYLVLLIVFMGAFKIYTNSLDSEVTKYKGPLLKEFFSYKNLGSPKVDSPYRLASATEKFDQAPIQMTIFSDFECPACDFLSKMIPKLAHRYSGKLNVQYFFYPLDMDCNPEITKPFHQSACKAAYLASCLPNKFEPIHDEIFENSKSLSDKWLEGVAKREGVLDCYKDPKTKEKVISLIEQGNSFNVASTPTILINGVLIKGSLRLNEFYIIFDELVKRAK